MSMITRNEATSRYQINKKQLFGLIGDGKVEGIPPTSRTGPWRINEDQLRQYVAPRTNAPAPVEPVLQQGDLLTLTEAQQRFNISARQLRHWVATNKVPSVFGRTAAGQRGFMVTESALRDVLKVEVPTPLRKRGRPRKVDAPVVEATSKKAEAAGTHSDTNLSPEQFITLKEAERLTSVQGTTIEHRAKRGQIPYRYIMIGNRRRFMVYKPAVLQQPQTPSYYKVRREKAMTPLKVEQRLATLESRADLNAQLLSIAQLIETGLFEVQSLEVTLRYKSAEN